MSNEEPELGRLLVRNAAWAVGARVILLPGWVLVTPYMLSALGTDRFAIWALFFALAGYFATFDLGMSQALVKFVAEFRVSGDRAALTGLVTLSTALYTVLGVIAVAGLAVWRNEVLGLIHTPPALFREAGICLVGMAGVLALTNVVGVMTAVLQGRQRMDVTNQIQAAGSLLQIVGSVAVLHWGGGLKGLVALAALIAVVNGALSWGSMRRIAPDVVLNTRHFSRSLFARLFDYSMALQVTNVGTLAQYQMDKLLLAHFVALGPVADFELGYRLTTAAWALPFLLLPPLIPAFSHLAATAERERFQRLYHRASRYLAAVTFPLAGFMIACAPDVVTAWLGPGHAAVATVTAGLSAFMLLTVLTGVANSALRGMGQPWLEARYHLVGIGTHLAASLWLVPRFGLHGALLAMGISGVLCVGYLLWSFHRRIGASLRHWAVTTLATPLLLSALAVGVTALFRGATFWTEASGRLEGVERMVLGAAVFAVVIAAGYLRSGFVTVAEVRDLVRGLLAHRGRSAAEKTV